MNGRRRGARPVRADARHAVRVARAARARVAEADSGDADRAAWAIV